MTYKQIIVLLSCFILKQALVAQVIPPPATQAEVDAGLNRFKYVTPYTLANSPLAGGPTNGITAEVATNIVNNVVTNSAMVTSNGVLSSTLLQGLGAGTKWVYWDDFQTPMTTAGIFPDAPSGHKYTVRYQYPNTNQINLEDGKWWMGATNGAIYLSTSFKTNAQYGPLRPPNVFEGTFNYNKSTNGTVDGVERNLTFILSTNADFTAPGRPFLHISIGVAGFRVERELSATNIIYAYPLEGSRYLAFNTNHTFRVTIISNNIICDYAGYKYIGYEPLLSTVYKDLTVATWESTGGPTNQFWGKWDSQRAGYSEGVWDWAFGGPFGVGSNGVLSSITFSDGSSQTSAGATQSQLTTASNAVVSLLVANDTTTSNGVLSAAQTYANGVTNSSIVRQTQLTAASNNIVSLIGSGSGGGFILTNLFLLGNTNATLTSGYWPSFDQTTNANCILNLSHSFALPAGYRVTTLFTNSGTTNYTVTLNTNTVAANFIDPYGKTNANSFSVTYGGKSVAEWMWTGSGWILLRLDGPTTVLKFGSGITAVTNGVNGLDVTISASGGGGSTTNAIPVTLAINGGTGSTNIVIDFWQLAQMSTNSVRVTLTANAGVVVTNIIDGKELVIDVVQDSTGNRTIAQSSVGGAPLRFGTDITGFGLSTNGTYIDHVKLRGVGTNAHVVGMIRGYAP